jgi:hypothetical protein
MQPKSKAPASNRRDAGASLAPQAGPPDRHFCGRLAPAQPFTQSNPKRIAASRKVDACPDVAFAVVPQFKAFLPSRSAGK